MTHRKRSDDRCDERPDETFVSAQPTTARIWHIQSRRQSSISLQTTTSSSLAYICYNSAKIRLQLRHLVLATFLRTQVVLLLQIPRVCSQPGQFSGNQSGSGVEKILWREPYEVIGHNLQTRCPFHLISYAHRVYFQLYFCFFFIIVNSKLSDRPWILES